MFNPTQEQINIFETFAKLHAAYLQNPADTTNNFLIEALAGCAKTSSVLELARRNPDKQFLMVCFNKKNSKELEERCRANGILNLRAATLHKIAYDTFLQLFPKAKIGTFFDMEWMQKTLFTGLDERKSKSLAYATINLLRAYCDSDFTGSIFAFKEEKTLTATSEVVIAAESYMNRSFEPETINKKQHSLSAIIKWFQLTEQPLTPFPADILVIEEYQDINENQAAILALQDNFKIAIGDINQNIYSWRMSGKMVEITRQEKWITATLSTSFRITQAEADRANKVLEAINPRNFKLKGASTQTEIKTQAFLYATNANSLLYAAELLEKGTPFNLNLDLKTLWDELWYIYNLTHGKPVKKAPASLGFIKSKKDWSDAVENMKEMKRLNSLYCKLSNMKGGLYGIQKQFDEMAKKFEKGEISSDITISTIHKFKGLEADLVTVDDDLFERLEKGLGDSEEGRYEPEDLRLLYVAVTRAKVRTILSEALSNLIDELAYIY